MTDSLIATLKGLICRAANEADKLHNRIEDAKTEKLLLDIGKTEAT